ncbi:MAG: hypothetical protein VYE73_14445, partial [Acidobacteriota bacterium]|nr:hypothetical protein [Acidobacteriota bacterium]
MDRRHSAAWAALAAWLGLIGATVSRHTLWPLWVLLAALGVGLRRGSGRWLAILALAALWAQWRWIEPLRRAPALRPDLPVAAFAEVVGPWGQAGYGITVRAVASRIEQRGRIVSARIPLRVFVASTA